MTDAATAQGSESARRAGPRPTLVIEPQEDLRLSATVWGRLLAADVRRLAASRFIIYNIVGSHLRVRYQRSILGFFWTLLHPLLMLAVLSVVFSQLLRFDLPRYPVFLFAGLIPWQFFAASLTNSATTLVSNQGLIRKVGVQLLVFPIAEVAIGAVNMACALAVLFVLLIFFGARLTEHFVLVPVGIVFLLMLTIGAGLVLMTLTTFFRDFEHFLSVFLQAMFFATPVFYSADQVPALAPLIRLNPLTWVLAFFKHGLYYHTWPAGSDWLGAAGVSAAALVIGYVVYKRHEHQYVFRL